MLNRSASLAMSTSILKALPGKLDIKRHSPSILYISTSLTMSTSVLKALPGKLDIKRHSPSILNISASLMMSTSVLKALPGKLDIKRHSPSILYLHTANTEIEDIVQSFSKLDSEHKLKCMSSLILSVYKEQPLKGKIVKLQSKYPYNKLETLEELDLDLYLSEFDRHIYACSYISNYRPETGKYKGTIFDSCP